MIRSFLIDDGWLVLWQRRRLINACTAVCDHADDDVARIRGTGRCRLGDALRDRAVRPALARRCRSCTDVAGVEVRKTSTFACRRPAACRYGAADARVDRRSSCSSPSPECGAFSFASRSPRSPSRSARSSSGLGGVGQHRDTRLRPRSAEEGPAGGNRDLGHLVPFDFHQAAVREQEVPSARSGEACTTIMKNAETSVVPARCGNLEAGRREDCGAVDRTGHHAVGLAGLDSHAVEQGIRHGRGRPFSGGHPLALRIHSTRRSIRRVFRRSGTTMRAPMMSSPCAAAGFHPACR
jgi:hypothetical protein